MADDKVLRGPSVPLPQLQSSIGAYFVDVLRSYGNKVLQVDGVTGQQLTGNDLIARGVSVARELRARGLRKGDVFSVSMDNCVDVTIAVLGGFFMGAVYAPFNPDFKGADLEHIVNLMNPKVALVTPRCYAAVKSILPESAVVVEAQPGSDIWNDFMSPAPPEEVAAFRPETGVDVNSVIAIMSSSGTTGKPKGVMLSHKCLHYLITILAVFDKQKPEIAIKDAVVQTMLNFWMTGLMTIMLNINCGITNYIYPKFDVDIVLGAIQKHKATSISLSPNQIALIAKHPNVEQYDVSTLRLITCSGAVLNESVRTIAERRLKKKIMLFYGQTECLMAILPNVLSIQKPNSSGTVAMNGEVKIIDHETGRTLGRTEEGEVCLNSPMKFLGYYKNPEATDEVIDSDGWVHTGDVGYLDEDGYLFVYDRYKDLIKFKGFHVAPADVEDVLMGLDGVKDAAVAGLEADFDQEHVAGFVVLQPGTDVHKLLKEANDQLPVYKQLHAGLYVVEQIPRTVTGKIKRRDLRMLGRTLRAQNKVFTANKGILHPIPS